MNFFSTFLLLGSLQGLILAIVFFVQKKGIQSKILSFVIATISLALLIGFFHLTLDFIAYPFLIKTSLPLPLVFIPCLYIYLLLLTGSIKNISNKELWYFLPLALILIYNVPFYFGDTDLKIDYFTRVDLMENQSNIEKIEDLFVNGIVVFFSVLSFIHAKHYQKSALRVFSDLEKAKAKWVLFLAFIMLVFSIIALILLLVQLIFEGKVPGILNFMTAMGSTVVVYIIAYYTLVHPEVFDSISTEMQQLAEPIVTESPSVSISDELADRVHQSIIEQKLYQNPELTLSVLAQKSSIPAYQLSRIISTKMNTNFYSLINQYRLEKVKNELLNKKGRGIMEIAYQAGFNSKSTFYDSFKKNTGMSPSDFVKKQLKTRNESE